jgi:hypothetical protein
MKTNEVNEDIFILWYNIKPCTSMAFDFMTVSVKTRIIDRVEKIGLTIVYIFINIFQ